MKKFIPLSLFAIAFALVEAAVVIYLRALYYPHGFSFPLVPPPLGIYQMEMWRELATLLMLVSAGWLAANTRWSRFAYFMYAFGLWDIFYYVWLKVFSGWPESFLTPDILFLLPVVWWGPVLAPCIVAASLCVSAVIVVKREGTLPSVEPADVALLCLGAFVILYTFMADAPIIEAGRMPPPYRWGIFFAGEFLGIGAFIMLLKRRPDGAQ